MIKNSITKDEAYIIAMSFIEKEYKLDIEEVYDNIKKASRNGKFYYRYYTSSKTKAQDLAYYFKNNNYSCNDNYSYKKDKDDKIVYDEHNIPIYDKFWIDLFWSL